MLSCYKEKISLKFFLLFFFTSKETMDLNFRLPLSFFIFTPQTFYPIILLLPEWKYLELICCWFVFWFEFTYLF